MKIVLKRSDDDKTEIDLKKYLQEILEHDAEDASWWDNPPEGCQEKKFKDYPEERVNGVFQKLARCMNERSFLLRLIGQK